MGFIEVPNYHDLHGARIRAQYEASGNFDQICRYIRMRYSVLVNSSAEYTFDSADEARGFADHVQQTGIFDSIRIEIEELALSSTGRLIFDQHNRVQLTTQVTQIHKVNEVSS